jgi:hypothetical protein
MYGGRRQLSIPGHRPDGPVSPVLRFGLKGLLYDHRDLFIRDRSRPAWAQSVVKTRQPLLKITIVPLADRLTTDANCFGDVMADIPLRRKQDDACPTHQAVRQGPGVYDSVQLLTFLIRQDNRLLWTAPSHGLPPSSPSGQPMIPRSNLIRQTIYDTEH